MLVQGPLSLLHPIERREREALPTKWPRSTEHGSGCEEQMTRAREKKNVKYICSMAACVWNTFSTAAQSKTVQLQ